MTKYNNCGYQKVQLLNTLDTLTDVDFSNISNNHRLSYVENIDM